MVKYVLKRVLLAFVSMFIILSLTFILIKLLPFEKPVGDDVSVYTYYAKQVNLGYLVDFSQESFNYGDLLWKYRDPSGQMHFYYQKPVMEQYFNWLNAIFTRWDWGTSVSLT